MLFGSCFKQKKTTSFLGHFRYILFLFILTGCGTTKYTMKPNTSIKQLAICMDFSEVVSAETQKEYEQCVQTFIAKFNGENHLFKLDNCSIKSQSAFRLEIKPFIYVDKIDKLGKMAKIGYIKLEVIEIVYNIRPYPYKSISNLNMHINVRNKSTIYYKLTEDLTCNPYTHKTRITNSAFFIRKDQQLFIQSKKFITFLKRELRKIERSQPQKRFNSEDKTYQMD